MVFSPDTLAGIELMRQKAIAVCNQIFREHQTRFSNLSLTGYDDAAEEQAAAASAALECRNLIQNLSVIAP